MRPQSTRYKRVIMNFFHTEDMLAKINSFLLKDEAHVVSGKREVCNGN